MKLCTQCESGYPDRATVCPVHGKPLTEAGDLPAGLVIRGAYRILRKLGHGSKGTVYLVELTSGGELKALKFLSPELSRDESFTSRFERAAKRLSSLHHPNVLATGDLQRAEDDSLFFAMEFIDGPSLRVLLNIAPGPFDPGMALAITRCVAEGLGAAHEAGMIHLDLKPESILIAREAYALAPKITNFGIGATREDGNTFLATGRVLLTPKYAAPEQWLNTRPELLEGRTDLYALGEILFEMLTRETVFEAAGYHAWARQHLTAPPRKPSDLRPELAEWRGLDDLVLALLAKEPGDRPKDAAALLALLDTVQFGAGQFGAVQVGAQIAEIPPASFVEESDSIEPIAPIEPVEPVQDARERVALTAAEPPALSEAPSQVASEAASEVAVEMTSADTASLVEPVAEQEPVSPEETPVSFSDEHTGELAVVEPAGEHAEPEPENELVVAEENIQHEAFEPPAEPSPASDDDAEVPPASAAEPPPSVSLPAEAAEFVAPEPVFERVSEPVSQPVEEPVQERVPEAIEDLPVTPEPEHFYSHELIAAEPEIEPVATDLIPSAEAEPTPAEANAFVPLFTAPEPVEEPVVASPSPLAAPAFRPAEPEFIPDALSEPAPVIPSESGFTEPSPVEEPVHAARPNSFAPEFRPSEPEFIPAAAPEPPRVFTSATQKDGSDQDSALDLDELKRLFGRADSSGATGVKPDVPPRRRTGAPNFFDAPADESDIQEGSPATSEPTNFFGKPYTPSGIEEPPSPDSGLPATVSFTEAFASAGDAFRLSQMESSNPPAEATPVDWIDSGRAADTATLRAAHSTPAGATSVTGFDFSQKAEEEDSDSDRRGSSTIWIVLAVVLLLAAGGLGFWRYTLYQADQPMAKLTTACTSGDGKACYDLAALYEQDYTVSDGPARAKALYSQACELKFPLACRKLGLKYLYGNGVALDTTKAIELFGKACDKADFESCDHLASIYHEGTGVPMDDVKAVAVYTQACAAGDDSGCTWAKRLAPPPPVKPKPRPAKPVDADSDTTQ